MNAVSPHERAFCGAKTRSGTPCKRAPLPNGRCNLHGGKALAGIASPTFATGRHSKYLPARLLDRYHAAAADPDLLALHDELALLDTRLNELLERVDSGESGQRWEQVIVAWNAYLAAADGVEKVKARFAIDAILEAVATDFAAWAEIHTIIEQRRKVSESEQKRLVAMSQMVTAEQAMTFVAALQASIRQRSEQHIPADTRRAFLRDVAADMALLQNRQAV